MKNSIDIISTASLTEDWLQQLQQNGINAEVIPFIKTIVSVSPGNAQRIKELEKYSGTAVFTSSHGVEAVAGCLLFAPAWKIACINGVTKKTVEWYFDEKDIIATAPNASALADQLIADPKEPILFFCGNRRLDTLPERLRAAGIQLEEIEVYKTELTPQEVSNKNADAVLFFSTTAVESFFTVNTLPAATVCFAIGETTAAAVRERSNNKIVVADQPGKKEVIDLVIKYYHEHS